jgi:hypothetical protein
VIADDHESAETSRGTGAAVTVAREDSTEPAIGGAVIRNVAEQDGARRWR